MNFSISKSGEKYEKKFQTAKDCAAIINSFSEKKNDEILIGSYYIKIKELYSLLELCENFDQVFEYVTKRFKAIKSIHEQSDQYNSLVEDLNKNLNKVEEKYSKLKSNYKNVMDEFGKYQDVLKNLETLEKKVQSKLLI